MKLTVCASGLLLAAAIAAGTADQLVTTKARPARCSGCSSAKFASAQDNGKDRIKFACGETWVLKLDGIWSQTAKCPSPTEKSDKDRTRQSKPSECPACGNKGIEASKSKAAVRFTCGEQWSEFKDGTWKRLSGCKEKRRQ